MKFKTRLKVTFATIIIMPMVLLIAAFILIEIYLVNMQNGFHVKELDYALMSDSMQEFIKATDKAYDVLEKQKNIDSSKLEDVEYLKNVENNEARRITYLIVRKNGELYYSGNEVAARKIFDRLPDYGDACLGGDSGYYYDDLEKYVKQLDFTFTDGSEGSVFVVTRVSPLISKHLLASMIIAMVLILVFTSLVLTQWIQKRVFKPVNELNVAMQRIKDGDLDYVLQTNEKYEIGDLYRNYEDMRMRLKESTEENIQQKNTNKELISNISHDLKTPITAIKGYVEGLMDGVADTPEKRDKYIRTIYNKANDMDRLINELTTYSGIDSNRIPYNFHRINVADYFGDCVEEVGMDLEARNIKLNYFNMTPADTAVIADPEQMKKVINNIISNSVKYMDKKNGVINIRILDMQDSVQIELEDNGKGIPQKDLSRIFERFYRTDASRNSAQGGSGIGLAIVKKIIVDHGGYIWATSKEGEGTCMHFVLRKYVELQDEKN
jgi:signal transduction histidine kinase